jgi:lysozyme family protein
MEFDQAFKELIEKNEGKFSLDPEDRGNWTSGRVGTGELKGTKYGISAARYPYIDIENLTLGTARELYMRDYWEPYQIDNMPALIRFDVFDGIVNSGPGNKHKDGAVIWAQMAAKTDPDGVVGAKTIAAMRGMDPYLFLMRYNSYRLEAMTFMTSWVSQGRGWARRIAKNLRKEL